MVIAAVGEVEGLKDELRKAKEEAAEQKATTERATAELTCVKTVSEKHKARVAEVQQELRDDVTKCEGLERRIRIMPSSYQR